MDASTAPLILAVHEPETMTALMLRYVEDCEEVAHQYAHALVTSFTIDFDVPDALQLARNIVAESTNDIRDFDGGEVAGRIDVALRRPIDRAILEIAIVPLVDKEAGVDSRALLHRFTWPY